MPFLVVKRPAEGSLAVPGPTRCERGVDEAGSDWDDAEGCGTSML